MSEHTSGPSQAKAYERPKVRAIHEQNLFATGLYGSAQAMPYQGGPYGWQYPYASEGDADEAGAEQGSGPRVPMCLVREEGTTLVLSIELPGVAPKAIDLQVSPWHVSVTTGGAADADTPSFHGELDLWRKVDPDKTKTHYAHGLLEVRLHVKGAESKRVHVEPAP